MTRPSLLIDLQRCVGCMSCVVACKMENDVPVGIALSRVETVGPVGEFPYALSQYFFPQQCQHCDNPLCVLNCPTGASYVREDGLVLVNDEACIMCGTCMQVCPYGARSLDETRGTARKCTLCAQLIDEDKQPSCVKHCIATARFYGDLDDPESDIARYLAQEGNEDRAIRLREGVGSEPTVCYLVPACGMLEEHVSGIVMD